MSLYWINRTSDSQATDGVYAGMDYTSKVYVCRVTYEGLTIPGKLLEFDDSSTGCDPTHLENELRFNEFEVSIF